MSSVLSPWICPSCKSVLSLNEGTWCCENKHSFDVAKEGYVNLLLAQHKNSKQPGDNKQMVNGRRAFLEQGFYQPLADNISHIVGEHFKTLENDNNLSFFDAGCGEGYYLNQVSLACQSLNLNVHYSGVDISKFAIQKAAKKYSKNQFAVASTYNLPLQNNSQDGVLQIFAPSSEAEICRVLKDSGIWITVNPAAYHLQEMKQALYDKPTEHKTEYVNPDGFVLSQQLNISFELKLPEPRFTESLLMMTPYYWSATVDKKRQLVRELRQVTTDFDICVFQKVI